jgi:hypothetical protein
MSKFKLWESFTDNSLHKAKEVADFLQDEFCPSGADIMWSSDYFNWKLGDPNPSGKGYLSYALHEDKVVGSATLTKKRVLLDGIEYIAGEVGDTYTSTYFRRKCKPISMIRTDSNPNSYVNRSIFGRLITELVHKSKECGVSIIYGTPNNNSYPGYTNRLGFVDYKQYGNTAYYRPTAQLLLAKYPILSPFRFIIKKTELLTIAIQNLLYSRFLNREVTVSDSTPSAEDINQLWLRIKPEFGFSLVRDALYWKHRYSDHPHAKYQFINFRRNGELVAVVVTRKFSSRADNSSVAVVEWMNEDGFQFGYILAVVMDLYKTSKVNYIYTWLQSSTKNSRIATRNLFAFKKQAPIIFADNSISRKLLASEKEVNFFLGSSDAI